MQTSLGVEGAASKAKTASLPAMARAFVTCFYRFCLISAPELSVVVDQISSLRVMVFLPLYS